MWQLLDLDISFADGQYEIPVITVSGGLFLMATVKVLSPKISALLEFTA